MALIHSVWVAFIISQWLLYTDTKTDAHKGCPVPSSHLVACVLCQMKGMTCACLSSYHSSSLALCFIKSTVKLSIVFYTQGNSHLAKAHGVPRLVLMQCDLRNLIYCVGHILKTLHCCSHMTDGRADGEIALAKR